VQTAIATNNLADATILKEAKRQHDLVVIGVSRRPGEALFFGNTASALIANWKGAILFVAS